LLLVASGCGGSKSEATVSAQRVVLALQHHGVRARTAWRKGVPQSGVLGLLDRFESPHVIAIVQASSPGVVVLIYDTAEHAKQRLNIPATGIPVRSRTSHKVIGRLYRVANAVMEVYGAAGISPVSGAAHDLAREAPTS
jgi:hypothetical protein